MPEVGKKVVILEDWMCFFRGWDIVRFVSVM